jgi:branched-chain amino acid transport system substrate-binding protein
MQLAIEDYNATTDLPGGNKIAWLACDDRGSVDKALTIAQHLTGTLQIQALVGPLFSEQVIEVAKQVSVPAGVFTITPTATAKSITALADDNLVWRPIASDVYQANALADRVLALSNPVATKVAMLGKDDTYGNGIISDVTKRLSPLLKAGFKSFAYPDPVTMTPDEIKMAYALILGQAWGPPNTHPDTMLFAGTSEVANLVLGTMSAWGAENPLPAVPRMIVTHGAVPVMETIVNLAPQAIKGVLMTYLEGVAPNIFDPQNFDAFNLRYRLRFNGVDAVTAGSLSYDAAMVTIFAIAAIPQGEPIVGATIAKNMALLVDKKGTPVSFGDVDGTTLTFIETAHNALITNKTVDLKGVSGELDFDLTTGEVRTDVVGWGLVPKDGMPDVPVLTPKRLYVLNPPPAETGTWMDLP